MESTVMYRPVRNLGVICNPLPPHIEAQKGTYILTSSGFSYCIYDLDTLKLAFQGPRCADLISALAPCEDGVIAALLYSRKLIRFHRTEIVFETDSFMDSPILGLFTFGQLIVVWSRIKLAIVNKAEGTIYGHVDVSSVAPLGGRNSVVHPMGHINSILVGGRGGKLVWVNCVEMKITATICCVRKHLLKLVVGETLDDWNIDIVCGSDHEPRGIVVALSHIQSSSTNPITPHIVLIDILDDEVLRVITLDKNLIRVTALAIKEPVNQTLFVGGEDESYCGLILFAGCQSGNIVAIDVLEGCIIHNIQRAHTSRANSISTNNKLGIDDDDDEDDISTTDNNEPPRLEGDLDGVTSLAILPSEDGTWHEIPFLSCGADNSMHMWRISRAFKAPMKIKSRKGFFDPIKHIEFYDKLRNGKDLLGFASGEAGGSSLGTMSFTLAHKSTIFPCSKALDKINRKSARVLTDLPEISAVASTIARHNDWPAIASCHKGIHEVFLWSALHETLTHHTLQLPEHTNLGPKRDSPLQSIAATLTEIARINLQTQKTKPVAISVALSLCGHFAVVGYNDGQLHHYNLQSRNHIGSFVAFGNCEETQLLRSAKSAINKLAHQIIQEINPDKVIQMKLLLADQVKKLKQKVKLTGKNIFQCAHEGPVAHVAFQASVKVFSATNTPGDLLIRIWDLQSKFESDSIDIGKSILSDETLEHRFVDKNTGIASMYINYFQVHGNTLIVGVTRKITNFGPEESVVLLVYSSTGSVFRCFGPVQGSITRVAMSPASYTLVCAARRDDTGSDLLTYDISAAALTSWLRFSTFIHTVEFHPTGAYLVTSHENCIKIEGDSDLEYLAQALFACGGLQVWTNNDAFDPSFGLSVTVTEPTIMTNALVAIHHSGEKKMSKKEAKKLAEEAELMKPSDMSQWNLLTISDWSAHKISRVYLEEEPEQEKENNPADDDDSLWFLDAPFHDNDVTDLVGWGGAEWATETDFLGEDTDIKGAAPRPSAAALRPSTNQLRAILAEIDQLRIENPEMARINALKLKHAYLKSPAIKIRRAILMLGPLNGGDIEEINNMLWLLEVWVSENVAVDFVQAALKLFFNTHGGTILTAIEAEECPDTLRRELSISFQRVEASIQKTWDDTADCIDRILCYIKHVTITQF